MFEQAILSEQFQRLLLKQQEVTEAYSKLLEGLNDPKLRDQFDEVLRAKQRHVRLSERLLEIVP